MVDISIPEWRAHLAEARTEAEIVNVVRRLLFTVPPEDLAVLPGECRHISVANALAAIASIRRARSRAGT